jgi:biotin synthase
MTHLDFATILEWLKTTDEEKLQSLWQQADQIRHNTVGNAVHLRGLLEISNHCARSCAYCGINIANTKVTRYRMPAEEIIACAQQAASLGYGTVVMQSGEDYAITTEWMTEIIKQIKQKTPLAVTLSLGERSYEELAAWKNAGADRYLLRFETSDPTLFANIHPPLHNGSNRSRLNILSELKNLGYEVGSGVMIGIPGQSYESLARDIQLFSELDLDMIGVGPYLPHPETKLGAIYTAIPNQTTKQKQVPNNELMTYKVIALTRITCPEANIPSTTALATLNKARGRELGLMRGANVLMPNLTPLKYRINYSIYPNKACITENALECNSCIRMRIQSLGRSIDSGPGSRNHKTLK